VVGRAGRRFGGPEGVRRRGGALSRGGPVVGGGSKVSLGGAVRWLGASAPVRVEVRRPAGTGGKAPTDWSAARPTRGGHPVCGHQEPAGRPRRLAAAGPCGLPRRRPGPGRRSCGSPARIATRWGRHRDRGHDPIPGHRLPGVDEVERIGRGARPRRVASRSRTGGPRRPSAQPAHIGVRISH
jgi:hypothetical protein